MDHCAEAIVVINNFAGYFITETGEPDVQNILNFYVPMDKLQFSFKLPIQDVNLF